jgi:hypothetical protein
VSRVEEITGTKDWSLISFGSCVHCFTFRSSQRGAMATVGYEMSVISSSYVRLVDNAVFYYSPVSLDYSVSPSYPTLPLMHAETG